MSDEDVAAELRALPVPEFEHTASTMPPPLASAQVASVTTASLRIDGVRNHRLGLTIRSVVSETIAYRN